MGTNRKDYSQFMVPKALHYRVRLLASIEDKTIIEFLTSLVDEYEQNNIEIREKE